MLITADELESRWGEFDDIVDVRSTAEWAADRLPGAISTPVLDDAQREEIGTLHAASAFEARRRGAALVARNIARAVDEAFADKPRAWRPLIYCWRGGNRSQAMATVLQRIGWRATLLKGGYAEFRRLVVRRIPELSAGLQFTVVCGVTGSGKTVYLQQQARQGAQVLDLEQLAHHRGSLLGSEPVGMQPSQKAFETSIWDALRRFDPAAPILVESESKKIGTVQLPDSLMSRMRESRCLELMPSLDERVDFLCQDYAHFFSAPDALMRQLDRLRPLLGGRRIEAWHALIRAQEWPQLVRALLEEHYDPTYLRSMQRNYRHYPDAQRLTRHPGLATKTNDDQRLSDLPSFSG
jgi:tRNA 2-selenouridine synthase